MHESIINDAFENGVESVDADALSDAVDAAIASLDDGSARVAEPTADGWKVNQHLKKAVLLSFRLRDNVPIDGGYTRFYDKVGLKYAGYSAEDFARDGVRVVPDAIVDRMRAAQASGEEAALEEGVSIAVEMIEAIRPLVHGFHLSAPSRRVDVALRVLRDAGVRSTA